MNGRTSPDGGLYLPAIRDVVRPLPSAGPD